MNKPESQTSVADTSSIKTKTVYSTDTFIKSERIDGPANLRDTANGTLLFILDDNVPVTTTEPVKNWLQIGIIADLTKGQYDSLTIKKGSKIFLDGKEIGHAVQDIRLNGAMKTSQGLLGELVGYSSIQNIKPSTIPENALCDIINSKQSRITLTELRSYLDNFEFSDYSGLIPNTEGFEIDENWIDDPSPLLRLWLIFEHDTLVGIFHSRPLSLQNKTTTPVDRGFFYTSIDSSFGDDSKLIKAFNSYIKQVD